MSGALIQLAATGVQDVYLTGSDYETEHKPNNFLLIFGISFFVTLVFIWLRLWP
ncbi:hypothetical protein BST79_gp226 [Only Syngen Nebraska virus 5]|uniref:hypothetical protein n=1 Tax=Only Syngen Nebraska virus 5 TaxID=1917232 RepID=UPI000900F64E|nr:hypothetical protein BST79_gp226 [Only Syngen Nebraska virus 5]APC25739.1 hypothetical protein [Only Syngen Nebraska virus 5]